MRFTYSVYRPSQLIQDAYKPAPSTYFEADDVQATPMSTVGGLQDTADGAKHIAVQEEDDAPQIRRKPVFPKEFSMAKFIANRQEAPRKKITMAPATAAHARSIAQAAAFARPAQFTRPVSPVKQDSPKSKFGRSAATITALIAGWYVAALEWASETWTKVRATPRYYSVNKGLGSSSPSAEAIRATLLGFGLFVAVMFTLFHHSFAPGTSSPQTAPPGPQTETLSTSGGSGGPSQSSVGSGQGNTATPKAPAVASSTAPGPASIPPSGSSATPIIGGRGGGTASNVPAPVSVSSGTPGSVIQPSGSEGGTLPTPSPQPTLSIPGVTTPLSTTVPGESVQDGSGKQIVGTSPATVTLN